MNMLIRDDVTRLREELGSRDDVIGVRGGLGCRDDVSGDWERMTSPS